MNISMAELCAGYGGIAKSVRAVLNADVAWYAEHDPADTKQHSSKILAHHMPGVPNHGDITVIDYAQVERVDLLTGGYPCQGQSVAGKQLGEDDPRWLWPHVARAVRALRPPLVFFENVRNHLRIGFDTVLGDLADAGYDVVWTTLKASAVGAPHHRDRLFILGVLRGADIAPLGLALGVSRAAGAPLAVRGAGEWLDAYESLIGPVPFVGDLPASGRAREGVLSALEVGPRSSRSFEEVLPTPRTSDSNGAGAHGAGGPDLRTVVSSLLPTPTVADSRDSRNKTAGRKPGSKHHDGTTLVDAIVMLRTGQERAEGHETLMDMAASPVRDGFDWCDTPYAPAIRRWERILGRPAPSPVNEKGRLEPRFAEWMQGLPDGWVTGVPGLPRNSVLKALGNGVIALQSSTAFRLLLNAAGLALDAEPALAVSA